MLPSSVREFAADENGATSIEYALIASIVSIAIVGALMGVKGSLVSVFESVVAGFSSIK
ncbi:Flp/Fap pilin component [Hyphomicrobium denitrificans ATCC 51888]|uniref:Flp/Fap pilin component n=1 Tax=Hyphomicrobium denitrificans (strain ATCC 51888 / DSM 1869 / NCIMB 11706 / TK 0415) TaxID=582899 RepID=D8JQY9_HYPDA|nr:Flp family type IVb pilin [Hyphomicrobium denitrificans]ADJ22141.1 Flp/Fap pilin component [Hyphomicrobium denitrificans ATCC 51888]